MPDEELLDMLEMIRESVRLVQDRFANIENPEDNHLITSSLILKP